MRKSENRGSRLPSEEPWDNDAQVAGAIVFVLACIVALVWQIVGRVK